MSRKKKNDKESIICLTPKLSQNLFFYRIRSKENSLQKKSFFKEKGKWRIDKK